MTSLFSGGTLSAGEHFFAALNDAFILLPALLLIFTWRGFIQATTARLMGDRSAADEGFMSLNPLAHVDFTGLMIILGGFVVAGTFMPNIPRILIMLVLVMLGVRWTYPVVFDDGQFKHYRLGGIITSLSGPLAHFVLGAIVIIAAPFILNPSLSTPTLIALKGIIQYTLEISLIFGVMDLIPLPPFDGGRVLRYILPSRMQPALDWLEQYAFIIFLIIFFVPPISDIVLGSIFHVGVGIRKMLVKIFR